MELSHGGDWFGYYRARGQMPLDFSANISPLGLPEGVRLAVTAALSEADRYPDPLCRDLRERLSELHGVPADTIRCGNGAADLLYRLVPAAKPRRALVPAPGFLEYERALKTTGCEIVPYMLREEDNFAVSAALLPLLTPDTDMLFLCEPGNPSGAVSDPDLLSEILARCRENRIRVIADECFMDFLEDGNARSLIPETRTDPQPVILRAFTKCYAMAGIRLGYCICGDEAFLEEADRFTQPWPVSHPAQAAGLAALEEPDYLRQLRELIARERPRLLDGLGTLGFRVIPGEANFLLFFSADFTLAEKLQKKGILIRDCRNFRGLGPGWYRTAVRTGPENAVLLQAMEEVLRWQNV